MPPSVEQIDRPTPAPFVAVARLRGKPEEAVAEIRARASNIALLVWYIVLPAVSMTQLSTFKPCHPLDDGTEFMPDDYTIQCWQPDHTKVIVVAIVGVLFYPAGTPAAFFGLLRARRRAVQEYQQLQAI